MSEIAVTERVQELRALVARLEEEHRTFASEIGSLQGEVRSSGETEGLRAPFVSLQDALTGHMLLEEFEVYPELARKGLFDSSISTIMQQHHDVSSCLGKMELSLRLRSIAEFKAALEELAAVLRLHQPAEEEEIFPLAVR